jgi:superfamily II DNA or RNA helicase
MFAAANLDMLRVVLLALSPDARARPSALDRRKHSKVFEICTAYRFDMIPWERLPDVPPGSARYDALGRRPADYGVDCCTPDYSRCLQAKWYGDTSTVTWHHIGSFHAMATVIGACEQILAIRTGGKIHSTAEKLLQRLPITVEFVPDSYLDEICALALIGTVPPSGDTISNTDLDALLGLAGVTIGTAPLRAWQADACECLEESLTASGSTPVYAAIACGGGKSRLCIELARTRLPCIVYVPARALAKQFTDEIVKWAQGSTFAIVDGDHPAPGTPPDFTICTYHSCKKVAHLKFGLCVVDEAHHALDEFASGEEGRTHATAMLDTSREQTLLVSATMPSKITDDDLSYSYSLANAVGDGVVVDYHLIIPVFKDGDTRPGLCRLIHDHPEWSRVLAYCNTIHDAELFSKMLVSDGISATWIAGATPPTRRKEILNDLAAGRIRVLVSVFTLGEGIDIPSADTAMFVQPRGSSVDVMQCIGRVLRLSPDTGKTLAYVVLPSSDEEKELSSFLRIIQRADSRLKIVGARGGFPRERLSTVDMSGEDSPCLEEAELRAVAVYDRLGRSLNGDAAWMANRDLVLVYVDEHHKLPAGKNGVYRGTHLGAWISHQRSAKKGMGNYRMTPEREAALEAIPGWYWEVDLDAVWMATRDLVLVYVDEHHKLPPQGTNGVYRGTHLGSWINTQRSAKKGTGTSKMTPEREAALEAIPGWYWEVDHDAAWMATRDLVLVYVDEHHKLPPQGTNGVYRGTNLGSWISHQRNAKKDMRGNSKMTPEREAALEAIPGWCWEVNGDASWMATRDLVLEYVDENHKLPPIKNSVYRGTNLGAWINNQRSAKKGTSKNKMTPEREAALEAIPGWYWGVDDVWMATRDLVLVYVDEHHKLPPAGTNGVYRGTNLGAWISKQRQSKKGTGKMTPEREAALEAIPGWYWGVDDVWMATRDLVLVYVDEHHKLPAGKNGVYRGANLGSWIGKQRQSKKGMGSSKMTPEREAALEEIPGWKW